MISKNRLVVLAVLGVPTLASAQTQWPAYANDPKNMPVLARDFSPVPATLPPDLRIEPPSADLAPNRARWSGIWHGWACPKATCAEKLAVEEVTATGAKIVVAGASERAGANVNRVNAKFVGDELEADFPNGGRKIYRTRSDGNIEVLNILPGGAQAGAGVLTKQK